jgi:outer membrane receptor protein involved in Fe transport
MRKKFTDVTFCVAIFAAFMLSTSFADEGVDEVARASTPDSAAAALSDDDAVVEITELAQAESTESEATEEYDENIEEVVVTGSQIRGAGINEALAVSVITTQDIDALGIESGDELLDAIPEQGQNFFNEAENISGGVNSARGDIGAFNLRNIGTGNTLVLLNGRRIVNSATFQTEQVGGSFIPVNSANSAAIPVFGVKQLEILRDGASAIYGADAVAGVVNTVMRNDFDGLSIRGRWTEYDNIPRDDQSLTIEWGKLFNGGRTAVGVFANYYQRDRVNSQDDEKWADADFRRLIPEGSPWEGDTRFRNNSANSNWGQYDIVTGGRNPYGLQDLGITDRNGEFETYPTDDSRCAYFIAENVCGAPDGQGTYRYNLNENRDLSSDLKRYNIYGYFNHEFDSGMQFYSEVHYYKSETNLFRHPSASFSTVKLRVGPQNYYNPFGPCGSPNRLPEELIGAEVPCEGVQLEIDNYRLAEVPRVVDNNGETYRFLAGMRGSIGSDWDWDSAIVWSESKKDEVTHNRFSNLLLQEALNDPTPAAYNPFGAAVATNYERAVVDVYRNSKADLKMIDFKLTNIGLFNVWGGPVGFLLGAEYREESFKDDRDPRLDGTIAFTDWQGDTFPFVSDVVNSSPTPDNSGSREVFSLFTEIALPLHSTFDLQLALRYEDFSDVGNTTVPRIAFGWRPVDWFLLRGSWSEAFRAPNLVTVNESVVARNNTRDDYACLYAADFGGDPDQNTLDCRNTIQRRATGSDELKPEKSDNTSIGMVLTPIEYVTLTLDFWKIEKQDTIGLFGEENHTLLDLLLRLEAGTGNCAAFEGNPAVARQTPGADEADIYLAAGICPAGDIEFVADKYANLDTREVEGFDVGLYVDIPSSVGDWSLSWQGSFYTRYEQIAGPTAQSILDAQDAGLIPVNYPVDGLGDLIQRDGNQEEKMNARLRCDKGNWGASAAWYYIGDFYQSSLTLSDGTLYEIPSHSYFNLSADYAFDVFNSRTRIRLGVNNVADERAPLADRYFGYFADAHRDYGRSYYVDLRMSW